MPASCRLAAEARSRDEAKLAGLIQEMLDCFAFSAAFFALSMKPMHSPRLLMLPAMRPPGSVPGRKPLQRVMLRVKYTSDYN